jgi:signal transduction histidine kinase
VSKANRLPAGDGNLLSDAAGPAILPRMRGFRLPNWFPAFRPTTAGAATALGTAGWTQYFLVVVLWLSLIGFVWFFIIAGTREIEATAEAQARNQAQVYADLVEEFVDQTLGNFDQDLLLLRDAYLRHDLGPDLRVWRASNYSRSSIAVFYSIIDAEGRLAATTGDQAAIGMELADRPSFLVHKERREDRPYLGVPVVSRAANRAALQLSRRIDGPDGSFQGAVIVSLDAEYYSRFFARTRARPKDIIALLGTEGTVRVRAGPEQSGATSYLGRPTFERMLAERTGTGRGPGASDGIDRFVAFRTLDEYGLIVYVAVAADEDTSILQSGIDFLRRIAWICTVLTGISALAIAFLLKRRHEAALTRTIVGELSRRMAVIGGLLDRSDAILLAVGGDGRVHYANARCRELFRGRAGAAAIQAQFRFVSDSASEIFLDRIRASQAAPVSFEQDLLDARDEQRSLLWVWSADDRVAADAPSFIGFAIDVTARRRDEMTAIRSDKISSLGEIAASIVHELNQPLNVIGLACSNARELLAGRSVPDGAVQRLDRIEQQVGRAAGILDRLRRYMSGSAANPSARFPIAEAVRSAEEFVADQLRIDGVSVTCSLPGNHLLHGDRLLFEQLIVNLVLNARDAIVSDATTRDAAVRGRIVVDGDLLPGGTHLRMRVSDTGPGLSDEAAARAFEPFFTTKQAGRGTGLGLPICRTIVHSFGGEIAIRNLARGACVEFSVLLDRGAASALAQPHAASDAAQ